ELRALGAHEFAPRGRIEEEIAHLDRRANRMRHRLGLRAAQRAIARDAPAVVVRGSSRGQGQARHRQEAPQRPAPNAERGDALETGEGSDLAGRVALERDRELVARDAAAVVAHLDPREAALLRLDLDAARAGIEAVLDQLLGDGSRALDDFAGRDLV